jgi:hypothetical protein
MLPYNADFESLIQVKHAIQTLYRSLPKYYLPKTYPLYYRFIFPSQILEPRFQEQLICIRSHPIWLHPGLVRQPHKFYITIRQNIALVR